MIVHVPNLLSPEEVARHMELADFKKMNQVRARVDATVHDAKTAEAVKPLRPAGPSLVMMVTAAPRRAIRSAKTFSLRSILPTWA